MLEHKHLHHLCRLKLSGLLCVCLTAVLTAHQADCCSLVDAIKREESTGNPLKQMLKSIDIPKHQLNESSIDLPIVPNKVLQHANRFHTPTDHEVSLPMWTMASQLASQRLSGVMWEAFTLGMPLAKSACCRPCCATILEIKA